MHDNAPRGPRGPARQAATKQARMPVNFHDELTAYALRRGMSIPDAFPHWLEDRQRGRQLPDIIVDEVLHLVEDLGVSKGKRKIISAAIRAALEVATTEELEDALHLHIIAFRRGGT